MLLARDLSFDYAGSMDTRKIGTLSRSEIFGENLNRSRLQKKSDTTSADGLDTKDYSAHLCVFFRTEQSKKGCRGV